MKFPISKNLDERFQIDILFASVFLIFSSILVALKISKGQFQLWLPSTLLLASLIYLLFNNNINIKDYLSDNENRIYSFTDVRMRKYLNISFFFCVSLIIYLGWSSLYLRPFAYFIGFFIAFALLEFDILSLNKKDKLYAAFIIFKIIYLAIIYYLGIYLEFPNTYGSDPWWHSHWIQETLLQGYITQGNIIPNNYYFFPFFHLIICITEILTEISIKFSTFYAIGIPMAITPIFIYLIGRHIFDKIICLSASLIIVLSVYNIERSTALIPMSLGYCFFLLSICILFNDFKKTSVNRILLSITSIAIVFTHTIASFVYCIFMTILYVESFLRIPASIRVVSTRLLTFVLTIYIFISLQNQDNRESFFIRTLSSFINSLEIDSRITLFASKNSVSEIPFMINIIFNLAYCILLFFAILQALYFFKKIVRSYERISIVIVCGIFLFLPQISMLLNLLNILPDRWFIFSYIPLSLLGVSGLIKFFRLNKFSYFSSFLTVTFLLIIISPLIVATSSNNDNPFFFNNAVRLGYTNSELIAPVRLMEFSAGRPISDIDYNLALPYILNIDDYGKLKVDNESVFIRRNYYLNHPDWDEKFKTKIHNGHNMLDCTDESFNILNSLIIKRYLESDLIYNNGIVKAYK